MSRRTRTSPDSSREYGAPLRLEPDSSVLLAAWWHGLHAVAAVGVVSCGLPLAVRLAGGLALALHWLIGRPAPSPRVLVCRPDGVWELPGRGPARFVLVHGTAAGPFWIVLRLAKVPVSTPGPGAARKWTRWCARWRARRTPEAVTVWLLADQLDDDDWRRLRALVGRARTAGPM